MWKVKVRSLEKPNLVIRNGRSYDVVIGKFGEPFRVSNGCNGRHEAGDPKGT